MSCGLVLVEAVVRYVVAVGFDEKTVPSEDVVSFEELHHGPDEHPRHPVRMFSPPGHDRMSQGGVQELDQSVGAVQRRR